MICLVTSELVFIVGSILAYCLLVVVYVVVSGYACIMEFYSHIDTIVRGMLSSKKIKMKIAVVF